MAYKHVPMSAKKRRHTPMVNFGGLDYADKRFSASYARAIEEHDFVLEGGVVQVRQGFSELLSVPSFRIYDFFSGLEFYNDKDVSAMWSFKAEDGYEHLIAAIGSILCEIKEEGGVFSALPICVESALGIDSIRTYKCMTVSKGISSKSAFVGMRRLWILSGNKYYCLRFLEGGVARLYPVEEHFDPLHPEEDTYIPTTTIGITEDAAGLAQRQALDEVNLMTQYRINKLVGGAMEESESPFLDHVFVLDGPIVSSDNNPLEKIKVEIDDYGILSLLTNNLEAVVEDDAAIVFGTGDATHATMEIVSMDARKGLSISYGEATRSETLSESNADVLVKYVFFKFASSDQSYAGDEATVTTRRIIVNQFYVNLNDFIAFSLAGSTHFNARWGSGASLTSYDSEGASDLLILEWNQGSFSKKATIDVSVKSERQASTTGLRCIGLQSSVSLHVMSDSRGEGMLFSNVNAFLIDSMDYGSAWVNSLKAETGSVDMGVLGSELAATYKPTGDLVSHRVYGIVRNHGQSDKVGEIVLFGDWRSRTGEGNIKVTYPCHTSGNADLINGCRFGIVFGSNGARNRLFASGNAEHPNFDWHSGEIEETAEDLVSRNGDFSYFPDMSAKAFGQTDNAIAGYDIVSDGKMAIFKTASDKEPTVYYRTPTTISVGGSSAIKEEYIVDAGSIGVGLTWSGAIANFNGDTVFISNELCLSGMNVTDSVANSRRYAESRSYLIDPKLKGEVDDESTFLWSNGTELLIVNPSNIYMTNYRTLDGESLQYEWWKMDIKNVSSICISGGVPWFGTSNGKIGLLRNGKRSDLTVDKTVVSAVGEIGNGYLAIDANVLKTLQGKGNIRFKANPVSASSDDRMFRSVVMIDGTDDLIDVAIGENSTAVFSVNPIEGGAELANALVEGKKYYIGKKDEIGSASWGQSQEMFFWDYEDDQTLTPAVVYLEFLDPDEENPSLLDFRIKIGESQYLSYSDLEQMQAACLFLEVLEADIVEIKTEDGEPTGYVKLGRKHSDGSTEVYDIAPFGMSDSFDCEGTVYAEVPINAMYVSAPYTAGDLMNSLTVYGWTIANDSNFEGSIEIGLATNDEDLDEMVVMASQKKTDFGFNITQPLSSVSFDKYVIPHKTTYYSPMSAPFISFAIRNEEGQNAVLATLQVSYAVSNASYAYI